MNRPLPRLCNGLLGLCLSLALSACSHEAQQPQLAIRPIQPEAASGYQSKPGWHLQRYAVAAANPLAAEAGRQILQAGGNALDAAIAVQMVLALVSRSPADWAAAPSCCTGTGCAWTPGTAATAPAAVDERLLLDEQGQPLEFMAAAVGGRAVGVPGLLKMLEAAHRAHGRLPWAVLLVPAIELAEQGFAVSPRLHALLAADRHLPRDPAAAAFYYPGGQPLAVGQRLRNPALAEVLRRVARHGSAAFYQGPVAEALVRKVQQHADNPGRLSGADLLAYRPLRREALCQLWRERYRVCGFPPPSSGN